MAETALLKLPIPNLTSAADGPDAVGDLAQAVEAKMTAFVGVVARGATDIDVPMMGGSVIDILVNTFALSVNGWAEIEGSVTLVCGGNVFAGVIRTFTDAQITSETRYHSQSSTSHLMIPYKGTWKTSGSVSPTIRVRVETDPPSQTISAKGLNYEIRQYGSIV